MANIWEKAISILAGNLNLGCSYLITTVTPVEVNIKLFRAYLVTILMTLSEPLIQMAVELINIHLNSVQQKRWV